MSTRGLAEVVPSELSPAVLRAALALHGAIVVRGLLTRPAAGALLDDVEDAFDHAAAVRAGACAAELAPEVTAFDRDYSWELGTVLAVDEPSTLRHVVESLRCTGIADVLTIFFGERPMISAKKTSLRWVPARPSARARRILSRWHEDGSFLGRDIRAVNVWTALTACGADAPSLEFSVKGAAVRAELDAGDAVLFDHRTQHRTYMSAAMRRERYGIECWFFAPSTFPMRQVPLAF